MKFRIYFDTLGWVPVEDGEIVNVAPHLVAAFAVHQCPRDTSCWKVSHIETGCLISKSTWESREDVIEAARQKLAKVDQKKFDKAVAKAAKTQTEREPDNVHSQNSSGAR